MKMNLHNSVEHHQQQQQQQQQHHSKSIPISGPLHRTASEVQLAQDEAIADYRDFCMYHRILTGMQHKNVPTSSNHNHHTSNSELPRIVTNIIRTRHAPVPPTTREYDSTCHETDYYSPQPPQDGSSCLPCAAPLLSPDQRQQVTTSSSSQHPLRQQMERLACHNNLEEENDASPSVYNGSFRGGQDAANVNINDSSYEEQGIFWMDF